MKIEVEIVFDYNTVLEFWNNNLQQKMSFKEFLFELDYIKRSASKKVNINIDVPSSEETL